MQRTVLKLGGSVLGGPSDASYILAALAAHPGPLVVVVSALRGVTDRLIALADAGSGREAAAASEAGERREAAASREAAAAVAELQAKHEAFAQSFAPPTEAGAAAAARLRALAAELRALLVSHNACHDRRERIVAFGERLAAPCLQAALAALGRPAPVVEPGDFGLVAVGPAGDAELDFASSAPLVAAAAAALGESSLVLPGFFGVGRDGLVRLFGRGGSDYSAACAAALLGARACVLVKDSGSVLTADPRLVPAARPVAELSYREAAALARGGAKIIHHRAVDPLEAAGVPLLVVGAAGPGGRTLVRASPAGRSGASGAGGRGILRAAARPRAIALGAGPAGKVALTVAGEGGAAASAGAAFAALELAGLGPWSIQGGESPASFRVLVAESAGGDALRALHAALFEGPKKGNRP